MPLFAALLFGAPMLIAEWVGWRLTMVFWLLLFVGSAVIKLCRVVF